MLQASRPRLRASAATALALYLAVLVAGPALLHGFACTDDPSPHCLLCASAQEVAPAVPVLAPFAGDPTDAGSIAPGRAISRGIVLPAETGDRAPTANLAHQSVVIGQ